MKRILNTVAIAAGVVLAAGSVQAQTLNVSSWGGAYTHSQQKAYHDPYMAANPGSEDRQSRSGVEGIGETEGRGRIRKTDLDLVDMTAASAIVACDEGLVEQIDADTWLAPASRRHAGIQGLFRRDPDHRGNRLLHSADRLFHDLRVPHRRFQG